MKWDFPVDACEGNGEEMQPWSAMMNGCILVNLIMKSARSSASTQHLFRAMFLFEGIHLFAHLYNVHTRTNSVLVHYVFMYLALGLYRASKPKHLLPISIKLHIIFDTIIVLQKNSLGMVVSGISLGSHILWRAALVSQTLVYSTVMVAVLIMNEAAFCETMMHWKPLPYHILVETAGFVAFDALANLIIDLGSFAKSTD